MLCVTLICSEIKSKQIGRNRSRSEQIRTNPGILENKERISEKIGKETGISEQLGTDQGDPLLPTPIGDPEKSAIGNR